MGLMDRWANFVAGPTGTEQRADGVTRARPLTAAGMRVNLTSPSMIHTRRHEWQHAAWDYRDEVPELRFAGDFVTSALGRLRVFPAENRPRGQEPIPLAHDSIPAEVTAAPQITEHTRQAAAAAIARLDLDRHGSSLLARMGENLEFAGECYLLGEPGDEGEQWTIRSVSEVQITQGGARLVEPGAGMVASRDLRPEQCELLRLWTPHPRYYDWPDASVSALLGTLEGMVLLGRRGRAHDRSRISSGKALFIPDELSLSRAGSAKDVDEDADPFLAGLHEAMLTPIRDESDPSAVVPLVIRGPGMLGDRAAADIIGTVDLHGEDPQNLDERYENLVQRFARGINLPPEIVKGVGDTNHWNGSVIDATMVKSHIEPRAERMVDALTAAYFRPALKAMGVPLEQRNRVCLWFDSSELVQNPNRDQAAKDAHTAGVISNAALARELGFTADDEPDNVERLLRAVDRERLSPASVPIMVKLLAGKLPTDQDMSRILGEFTQSGQPRIIEGGPPSGPPDSPGGVRTAPTPPSDGAGGLSAAATKRKGPRDDPQGPSVAGVALMAADTGRVLMLQRGLDDEKDPAAGTWEFPGGHIEDGDETSLHGGMREWAEEVGQPFPDGGAVVHTWTSPDGVYQGHVVVIESEKALDLGAERTVTNADDDYSEQAAWWDPDHAAKNPALRRECRKTPWSALKRAVKTVRSPVTAASGSPRKAETKFRVDEAACRKLAAIDRALTDRLVAHAEATVGRAVEKAAARVRGRAQRDPVLAAAFPKGSDPVAVCAAAGRQVQGDMSDEQALDGALDQLAAVFERETRHSAGLVERVVARLVGKRAAAGLAGRITARIPSAWQWLRGRLQGHIAKVLYGEQDGPQRDGEQGPDIVPVDLIRGALAEAGGLPEQSAGIGDDGRPAQAATGEPTPLTGPGTGEDVRQTMSGGGAEPLLWRWGYYGIARKDPFVPHQRLDGRTFDGFADPGLDAGKNSYWIGPAYHPGDHTGCMCSIEMIWATPDEPSTSEVRDELQTTESDTARENRELLAEDDDLHPGRGTLPDGRTHAQRDRDTQAELDRLRREHMTAREGSTT
ncbi:MAG: NUDIX hydrolase [Pseudonocardia sp.]|nr:NUDIX hydrolase [Pseudonocardia sp.]